MKLDTKNESLEHKNLAAVKEWLTAGRSSSSYDGVLCLIADILDSAARGDDCYATLGATRNRDALLLSVKQGRASAYAGGLTLAELSLDAERLL